MSNHAETPQHQEPDASSGMEIVLCQGESVALVSPFGAALRGFYQRTGDHSCQEIVTRYAGASLPPAGAGTMRLREEEVGQKIGGQGDVLIPFPGRIGGGAYEFQGQPFQLLLSDHEGPNAIHGFLRSTVWNVDKQTETSATFSTAIHADTHKGYPFSLETQVSYTVGNGLTCSFAIKNTGDRPAPVAAGFHPYFTTGSAQIDENELHVPMNGVLEMDEGLLPTGNILPVETTALDFRQPRLIGGTTFNTCYLHPRRDENGLLRIRMKNLATGRRVTVWMDGAFNYVVIYSGDPLPPGHRRQSLAIEPMTCGSDAFNHPDWGLAVLQPGQSLWGSWGVEEGWGTE